MTAGDRLRWLRLQKRKAQMAAERIQAQIEAIHQGVRAALARPGRYDPSWAEAREVHLVRALQEARAKVARLDAELRP